MPWALNRGGYGERSLKSSDLFKRIVYASLRQLSGQILQTFDDSWVFFGVLSKNGHISLYLIPYRRVIVMKCSHTRLYCNTHYLPPVTGKHVYKRTL